MTQLALAARNFLAQNANVTALLGSDALWSTYIFANTPEVVIEGKGTAMIVVTVDDGWAAANEHNTARFPRLVVDIWVDPSRNPDGSVKRKDSRTKADAIYQEVDKHLHQMQNSRSDGSSIFWGTHEQIVTKTGVRILSSKREGEPSYRPAFDDQGAVMATVRYQVSI